MYKAMVLEEGGKLEDALAHLAASQVRPPVVAVVALT
jgi:hypothetical protein